MAHLLELVGSDPQQLSPGHSQWAMTERNYSYLFLWILRILLRVYPISLSGRINQAHHLKMGNYAIFLIHFWIAAISQLCEPLLTNDSYSFGLLLVSFCSQSILLLQISLNFFVKLLSESKFLAQKILNLTNFQMKSTHKGLVDLTP